MSEIKDGGSAFPLPVTISPAGDEHIAYQGMTLRDYFAAKAMQGALAGEPGSHLIPHNLARDSMQLPTP